MKGMQVENIYQKMWSEHFSTKTKFEYNIFLIYSKTCNTYCTIFLSFQEWKENLDKRKLVENCLWLGKKNQKKEEEKKQGIWNN